MAAAGSLGTFGWACLEAGGVPALSGAPTLALTGGGEEDIPLSLLLLPLLLLLVLRIKIGGFLLARACADEVALAEGCFLSFAFPEALLRAGSLADIIASWSNNNKKAEGSETTEVQTQRRRYSN